jgi:hypothetical protein
MCGIDIVAFEMAEEIESWRYDADAVKVLLWCEMQCALCGEGHEYFINRDGRTRCVACDDEYLAGATRASSQKPAGIALAVTGLA